MTAAWNPWGLPELSAQECEKLIKAVAPYRKYYEPRVEVRGDHDFLCIYNLELGCGMGADLIAKGDVDAVRAMLTT